MVRYLRGCLGVLFLIALIGCLETDPTAKGSLFLDEENEGGAYTPPTPIFRDIRIIASASHLTANLTEGSEMDQFAVVLIDLSLSSAATSEDSPSLTDQDLLLDLMEGEPVEIGSVRLFEDSPYDEVRLTFSEITIGGSFEADAQGYTFEYSSSEPTESSATIPADLLTLEDPSADTQTLTVSEAARFDLEVTLPTLETYEEIVSVLEEFVIIEELPPEVPLLITDDSADPIAESIRERIRRRFGAKRGAKVARTRKAENRGEAIKPRKEKEAPVSSREGGDEKGQQDKGDKPTDPASGNDAQGNDDRQGKKEDVSQKTGNSPGSDNQQVENPQKSDNQQDGNKTEQGNQTPKNGGGNQGIGNSGGGDPPKNGNGNQQNNGGQGNNQGNNNENQGKKKK